MDNATESRLHQQLVKLGDMMGDGLHNEPGGKWITREYNKVLKALGLAKPRRNNSVMINQLMIQRVKDAPCKLCGGALKQNRSGSKRAKCIQCQAKFQLLK